MERHLKSPQRGKSFRHLSAEKEKNRHIKVPKMSIFNGVFHLFVVAFCYVLVYSLISYMRHPVLHQFCGGFCQFLQSFCLLMIIAHLCMVHLVSLQSLCSCCNNAVQETLGQCSTSMGQEFFLEYNCLCYHISRFQPPGQQFTAAELLSIFGMCVK